MGWLATNALTTRGNFRSPFWSNWWSRSRILCNATFTAIPSTLCLISLTCHTCYGDLWSAEREWNTKRNEVSACGRRHCGQNYEHSFEDSALQGINTRHAVIQSLSGPWGQQVWICAAALQPHLTGPTLAGPFRTRSRETRPLRLRSCAELVLVHVATAALHLPLPIKYTAMYKVTRHLTKWYWLRIHSVLPCNYDYSCIERNMKQNEPAMQTVLATKELVPRPLQSWRCRMGWWHEQCWAESRSEWE